MFERVNPGGVASLLARIEFVKFVGGKGGNAEEGMEEDLQVFVVSREDGICGKWGERDVDDGQRDVWVIFSRSEAVYDCRVEFVCVGEVEVEAATSLESFGAQGTLVEVMRGVKDKGVIL